MLTGQIRNDSEALLSALAALVIRQAYISLIDKKLISGTFKRPNIPIGLTSEDHKAMSLVSAVCLHNGLPDYGSEIHELLYMCTKPLGEWLPSEILEPYGMALTSFIDLEDGVPTVEAQELAAGFSNLTTHLENQLFQSFMEKLSNYPEKKAYAYYALIRENVVRYPVIEVNELQKIFSDLPAVLSVNIQQFFYEPVPSGWQNGDSGVPICAHCGNSLKDEKSGLACRTNACNTSLPTKIKISIPSESLLRVNRGIKQYWVEPGFDEIRMYDALLKKGYNAILYPKKDLVDIAVGDFGIDLKAYTSPETLGMKFNNSMGGLAHYKHKWIVIPDSFIKHIPSYLERLTRVIKNPDLQCFSVSEALNKIKKMLSDVSP